MVASSDVDICNKALRLVREQPIAALTQDTERARICREVYDDARDYLLARHPSNFSINDKQLNQISTAPTIQYDYRYTLPTTPYCLRALKLWHNGAWWDNWVIHGRNLLTNADDDVYLRYISRVTTVTDYSPTFVEVLAAYVGSLIAYPLTRDENREDIARKKFKEMWKVHKSADGGEGFHEEFGFGVFTRERD